MTILGKLFHLLRQANRLANRLAGPLLLLGLAAVALRNWRLWQEDKAFLARRGQPAPLPPLAAWPELPLVSVLVAAWNEADNIERHIDSFLALRYPHKELVLCAGGPDGTYGIAARYANNQVAVLRQQSGEGKQRALARSFGQTQGEVIFLTDADCLLADQPFERTLWPVVGGGEQAATGSYRPLDEQLDIPFAFAQVASHLYSAMRGSNYAAGLSGANCALRRTILEVTTALDAPAQTGTDYVLAKTLDAAGVRIRQAPESRMATDYPTTARAYLRQQRRWLRNVFLHGWRFGAADEVRNAARTSSVGVTMLSLPLAGLLLAHWLLAVWGVLAGQALAARLRYLGFAGRVLDRRVQPADAVWQGPLLLLDFVAWTQPLADYVRPRERWMW